MKISSRNPILVAVQGMAARPPVHLVKGFLSANIAFPLAERYEKRELRTKLRELRGYYKLPFGERDRRAKASLVDTVKFAGTQVPYYQDLFSQIGFDPEKIEKDTKYLEDIPYLTKEIIREQGERLYSVPLTDIRHYICKTGGSTGLSCHIAYDQSAADYSSAVTLYARERVGDYRWRPELHFACRFPDMIDTGWPTREDFKCFAMNRSNIFFDRLDDVGLGEIWETLRWRRPYLVHAHPSTIYALACFIERTRGSVRSFSVFESSGELLQPYMRDTIQRALGCNVVDRYGLAELGVMAYELDNNGLQVLTSEGWAESRENMGGDGGSELVFTGFRNRLMPLIRYATGDLADVERRPDGVFLTNIVGRIHDIVNLAGVTYPTHTIQDMLDHRVGGIQEFQIDVRGEKPILRIVPEPHADTDQIAAKIQTYWPDAMKLEFIVHDDLLRVGHRAKFRHVVTA